MRPKKVATYAKTLFLSSSCILLIAAMGLEFFDRFYDSSSGFAHQQFSLSVATHMEKTLPVLSPAFDFLKHIGTETLTPTEPLVNLSHPSSTHPTQTHLDRYALQIEVSAPTQARMKASEDDANRYLHEVAMGLDLPQLLLVTIGTGDGLYDYGVRARFNPTTLRIVLSTVLSSYPKSYQRHVILHEIAHAVALFKGIKPHWRKAQFVQTNQVLSESLLGQQLFDESFADAFAVSWALRMHPTDSAAWRPISKAMGAPTLHASAAHSTFITLRLLKSKIPYLSSVPSNIMIHTLQEIAAEGSIIAIAHLEAEREAVCFMGARGLVKYARDMGYSSAPLPWEMAQTYPIVQNEPYYEALSELSGQRVKSPFANPWRNAMTRTQEAISVALKEGHEQGLSPDQVARLAQQRLFLAHRDAVDDESFAAAYSARVLSQSRSPWKEQMYTQLFSAIDQLFPAPAPGCPKF